MRDRAELVGELHRQLRLLAKAARAYDAGDEDEAANLSIRLRVLFHEGTSPSLLQLLGARRVQMVSTALRSTDADGFSASLTTMTIGWEPRVAEFAPRLGREGPGRPVSFDHWWNKEFVYVVRDEGVRLTRRDLVTAAANQDGGAHVAEAVDARYRFLTEGAGWSITYNPDNGPSETVRVKNAHRAALRQIAHEVQNTPDLLLLK